MSACDEHQQQQASGIVLKEIRIEDNASTKSSEKSYKLVSRTSKIMTNLVKRPPVRIDFTELRYTVREHSSNALTDLFRKDGSGTKTILKGVSGQFAPGELVAIMGPSGAGKSTLMNILAGCKTSNVDGQVSINGKPRNLRRFRKMSCYIMQDDCLSPHLTVAEAMSVAAKLKLGAKTTTHEQRKMIVSEIVEHLGLSECWDVRTNRISGGQRKRLAIALELVNNPPVMFFDEPTSGLDSSSCSQCIKLLKELAREGRTIVCTIHQPSAKIFELFDKLYLLCEGRNIYRDSVSKLVPFLSGLGLECPSYHNPADFVMEVATGEYGSEAVDKMEEALKEIKEETDKKRIKGVPQSSDDDVSDAELSNLDKVSSVEKSNGEVKIRIVNPTPTSPTVSKNGEIQLIRMKVLMTIVIVFQRALGLSSGFKLRILFIRTFKSIIRDETLTKLRIISHVSIGFLLGMLYWDIGNEASKVYNNSAMLFFCMLFCMFTAMMPTVMTFPMEMSTFKREHLNYWYSMKSYYWAKVMADMPFQIVYPLIFVVIVYFMTSQPLEVSRVFMFILMCILTSLVAQSLGLVIGCACDIQSAVYLGPITTIPILLFSGFFVSLDNIPILMQWLTYVAYVRYGFEGTMIAIYGFDRENLQCSVPYCHFKYPEKFLEELALDKGVFWIDAISLVAFFILLRITGYFVLRYKLQAEK